MNKYGSLFSQMLCLFPRLEFEKPVPENRNILNDEVVKLKDFYAWKHCPYPLRRIEVFDREKEEFFKNLCYFGPQ